MEEINKDVRYDYFNDNISRYVYANRFISSMIVLFCSLS